MRMKEVMVDAHEFLQHFCFGYKPNQALLYKHLDLFIHSSAGGDTVSCLLASSYGLLHTVCD